MKRAFSISALSIITVLSFFWFGCNKGDVSVKQPVDPLAEKVTASLQGRVINENGEPVGNAAVTAGTSATATNINGYFQFNNIQVSKNAGFVRVEKTGYFKTGRTIFTNTGVVNNIEVKLIPRKKKGDFAAASGGTISVEQGASVNFPVDGIINELTKSPYTGTVSVFGAYLSPEDPALAARMPGNLTGLTTNNEQKILQTFGMVAIELEGSNGEKLNIATGKKATITMPIPAGLLAAAPVTIPLWYFNDTVGIWKEEGTAAKQGSNYIGTVAHFSFWNCDVPNDFVNLTLTLKNQNEELLAGYRVTLKNTSNNSTATGITDSSGTVIGAVPPGVSLEMKVYNKCNTLIHTQTIGPFTTATNLGTIMVTTPQPGSITVSGTVKNCNQVLVTNGFVDLRLEGIGYRAAITNGNYQITIARCSNATATVDIIATDNDAQVQGSTTPLTVTVGNYTANLTACGVSTAEFINFTIGGNAINFLPATDSLTAAWNNNNTTITGYRKQFDSANYQYTSITYPGAAAAGSYILNNNSFIVTKGFNLEYGLTAPATVTITEYGTPGQYISGSFSGNMKERYTNVVVSGTCNFRVRRFQ